MNIYKYVLLLKYMYTYTFVIGITDANKNQFYNNTKELNMYSFVTEVSHIFT